jgi:four helix bundle protein
VWRSPRRWDYTASNTAAVSIVKKKGLSIDLRINRSLNNLQIRNPNIEARNKSKILMTQDSKRYDLEDRTLEYAKKVRVFVKNLRKTVGNLEDGRQLIRASGSVGANYIEANESLTKKDFIMRIKICRKEAKESRYWLMLVDADGQPEKENDRGSLIKEATELMNIFGAILAKSK